MLKQGENRFDFRLSPDELGFAPCEVSENPSFKRIIGSLLTDFSIVRTGQRLLLNGRIRFRAELACSLCGEDYECDFDEPLTAEFADYSLPRSPHRIKDEEIDQNQFWGDELELIPIIHDAIHLAVPIAPCCREDCRGLCPTCGADLNQGPCNCPTLL